MTRKVLEQALLELSRIIEERFDGRAALSLAAGQFILTTRELTGDHSIHDQNPSKILDAMLGRGCVCGVEDAAIMVLYRSYPRPRDVEAARRAIRGALVDTEIPHPDRYLFLQVAVQLYKTHYKGDPKMIPYPATWFRRKSYLNNPAAVLRTMQVQRPDLMPARPNWSTDRFKSSSASPKDAQP